MRLNGKYLKVLVIITLIISVFAQPLIIPIYAQSGTQSNGNGISVSPVKIQRNFKGNDKDTLNFTLLNNEDQDIKLSVTLKSFKLLNNNQEISFDTTIDETVLNWIRNFKNSVVLKPKEKTEYKLELNIPGDTKPGGYLFGIFFETQGKFSGDYIKSETIIKQSIGVPVIVNIAGVEGISYGQITLDSYDVSYNIITNSVDFSVVILNNSNQIITPTGVITIKKVFGTGPEELTSSFNSDGKLVNAFSLRSFTKEVLLNRFTFGRFEAKLDFLYGLENNVYSQTVSIYIIPIGIPVIILVVILLIIFKLRARKLSSED